MTLIKKPNWMKTFAYILLAFFAFSSLLLIVTPWQQTSQGTGEVIAIDPNDRVQNINSPVPGRISNWFVNDGVKVKKGDPIVEITDNDPNFLKRLKIERDAILKNYEAKKVSTETAELNYTRQKELLSQGLVSKVKFEKAKITYKKLLAEEAEAAAKLASAEVKFSRQQTQLITAPRDGTILRVLHGSGSVFVSEGDVLAVFVPKTLQKAAVIYMDGNDLPLIYPGRKVRLQFEGWPAVQFSGWPSVAVGTFGGLVKVVDPSVSSNGRFRVIVIPDPDANDWPDTTFLRQGARVYGWVLLNTVQLGYELWRQFNGFPPSLNHEPNIEVLNSLGLSNPKDDSKKSDKKKSDK